jgi:hypothetical protein
MRSRSVLASVPFVVAFGCARAQVPLPPDLSIETPGSSVPAEDAAFSGAWGNGAWSGNIPTALIVEQIAADGTAEAIYARGAAEHPEVGAGWRRMQGRIKDHCLTLQLPDPMSPAGYRIQYRVIAPGHCSNGRTGRAAALARYPHSGAVKDRHRSGASDRIAGNVVSHPTTWPATAGDPEPRLDWWRRPTDTADAAV